MNTILHEQVRELCISDDTTSVISIINQPCFDWNKTDQYGMYPVHNICKYGSYTLIYSIIHSVPNLNWNVYNWDDQTCLLMIMNNKNLSEEQRVQVMKSLIEAGADPYQKMFSKKSYILFDIFIQSKVVRPTIWIEYFKLLYPKNCIHRSSIDSFLQRKLHPSLYTQMKEIMDQ